MEAATRFAEKFRSVVSALAILVAATSVQGCSSGQKKSVAEIPGVVGSGDASVGPQEAFGPTPPPPAPFVGPEPVSKKAIVLVLGPGAARGFAHAGVLRALSEAKIPIAAIVGTDMGALVGSLYTSYPSLNGFEWEIQKLKENLFVEKKGILDFNKSPTLSDGEAFEAFLKQSFGARDLKDARLPLRIFIREANTDRVAILDQGKLGSTVRAAMAIPTLFEPVRWGNKWVQSATAARPFPVSEAKAMNRGPVVVVNVINTQRFPAQPSGELEKEERSLAEQMELAERSGQQDLAAADLIVEPDLNGIGFLDFGKRSETAFRGKEAVRAQLAKIKALTDSATSGVTPQ